MYCVHQFNKGANDQKSAKSEQCLRYIYAEFKWTLRVSEATQTTIQIRLEQGWFCFVST